MKTASAGLTTHLALEETTLSVCVKITRKDASQLFFSDHDKDLVVSGDTYTAAGSVLPSAIESSLDYEADNLEFAGILSAAGVTEANLRGGLYDNAAVEIFLVNWVVLGDGTLPLKKGFLGRAQFDDNGYSVELRGLKQKLQATIGQIVQATCRVDLGSAECGVRLQPPIWGATTAYTVRAVRDAATGSVVRPTTENGRHFKCTTAGTSGGSEPTWDLTIGNTTADGSVVWTTIQGLTVTGTVTGVTDARVFTDTSRSEAHDFFMGGLVTWTSGDNNGLKMEVKLRRADASDTNQRSTPLTKLPRNLPTFSLDRTMPLLNGRLVTSVEVYHTTGARAVDLHILERTSAGTYDVKASAAELSHTGSGWESIALAYAVPATGEFFVGAWFKDAVLNVELDFAGSFETPIARATLATEPAGAGNAILEDIGLVFATGAIYSAASPPGGAIELFQPMVNPIQVGDQYKLTAGCNKSTAACKVPFDNILNFRGEPFVPGEIELVRFQNASA